VSSRLWSHPGSLSSPQRTNIRFQNSSWTVAIPVGQYRLGLNLAFELHCAAALWWRRPHTVLDLWLMVVMCAWLFDIALCAVFNAARFDVGWYAGRICGLLAATFVLVMLLLETAALYAQLVGLLGVEQRKRLRLADRQRRLFRHVA